MQYAEDYCAHSNRHLPRSDQERSIQFCCPICEFTGIRISFNRVGKLKEHFKGKHQQFFKHQEPSTSTNATKKIRLDERDPVDDCIFDSADDSQRFQVNILDSESSHSVPSFDSKGNVSKQEGMHYNHKSIIFGQSILYCWIKSGNGAVRF